MPPFSFGLKRLKDLKIHLYKIEEKKGGCSMNNIQETLFRTIETIADKKIGQIKFDKTVEAIVESDKNKGAGEYSLRYQDVIFVAYTASNTDSFNNGDNVLVLIPEGDMSNRKTIISSSKREGESYIDVENIIDRLSANMVSEAPDFEIELSTTENETVDFNINKTQMINSYVGKKFLAIGAELYTNINTEDIDGMYGIALDCIFLTDDGDRIPYTFEFTNLHVTGNPYQARGYKETQLLLPKERLVEVIRARAFSRGFSKGNEKIKMKNLVIQYVSIREQDTSDYVGKIIAPKGTYFRNGSLHPDEKLSLVMEFRQKGEVLNTPSIEYKWFIMNSKINDITNPSYHPEAGLGWEWIKRGNYDEELISGEDTNNILVSSAFVPNFLAFKCVATYKELKINVSDTITLVDHTDNISVDIDSSNGVSFVNGLGETTLTCNVRQNNEPVDETLEYEWTQINSSQEPILLQKGSRNNIRVSANTLGTKSTFTCQVVEANTQNPIGTGYTTLVNVTEGINEGVNIIGGFRTVLYDGLGAAPTNLPKEGFQFELTSNGEVVTENIEWYWKIPAKGKTMLTLEGASLGEDGQQISKAKVLHLGVQDTFDLQKNQNYVELEVRHTINGVVRTSTAIAVISITKVGQNGADGAAGQNGLDGKTYVYHLLGGCPSVTYNKEGRLPQPASIPPIELMFSVDGDNKLAKEVDRVEWYIQREEESLLSFRGSEKKVRTKTTTKTKDGSNPHIIHLNIEDVYALNKFNNFVAATITYKDRVYREVFPISVIKNGSDGKQGEPGVGYMLNITGGNRGIAYSAVGTDPEPSSGGEFSVELINNTEVLTPSSISWTAGGNFSGTSKSKTFRPVVRNTYGKVSTFVNVAVEYNGATINQTIPIVCTKHADGLDWLEDWNNNSVIVDEKGRKIISPKMFAGTKDYMGRVTGVALGRDVLNSTGVSQTTGVVGYKNNVPVFSLSDKADFYVSSRGNAGSVVDGTANGLYFDGSKLYLTGAVKIQSGTMGSSNTNIDTIINNANSANNKVQNTIVTVDVQYVLNLSPTQPPSEEDEGWSTNPPVWQEGKYIWSRNKTVFMNGREVFSRPVCITGHKGETGASGSSGKGISEVKIEYVASSSGTETPSSGWQTEVPSVAPGQYLWTRMTVSYTSGSPTVSYSIGKMGENGANGNPGKEGVGIRSTDISYQVSTSGTTPPVGSWLPNIPSIPLGQYLWSRTVTHYTDGRSSTVYTIGRVGQNGAQGEAGQGIQSITELYQMTNSKEQLSTPTSDSGWTTTPPRWESGKYIHTCSKIVYKNPTKTEYTKPVCDSSWEAVNDIQVGGRNILKDSKGASAIVNPSYPTASFVLTERPKEGEQYTIQIKGQLAKGSSYWGIYNSGSSVEMVTLGSGTLNSRGIYTTTFNWRIGGSPNTHIQIYPIVHQAEVNSTIEWVKLEKGNKATDWTPSPEDVEHSIDEVGSLASNATIAAGNATSLAQQTANNVKDFTMEVDGHVKVKGDMIVDGTITGNAIRAGSFTIIDSKTNKPTFSINTGGSVEMDGLLRSSNFDINRWTGYRISPDGKAILNQAEIRGDIKLPNAGITNFGAQLGNKNIAKNTAGMILKGQTRASSPVNVRFTGGEKITISADFDCINLVAGSQARIGFEGSLPLSNGQTMWIGVWHQVSEGNFTGRKSATYTVPTGASGTLNSINWYANLIDSSKSLKGSIGNLKVEISNETTPWCPAPEDDANPVRFWAGKSYDYRDTAPFQVKQNGDVVANNVLLSGRMAGQLDSGHLHISNGTLVIDGQHTYMADDGKMVSLERGAGIEYIRLESGQCALNTNVSIGNNDIQYNLRDESLNISVQRISASSTSFGMELTRYDGLHITGHGGSHFKLSTDNYYSRRGAMVISSEGNQSDEGDIIITRKMFQEKCQVKIDGSITLDENIKSTKNKMELKASSDGWGFYAY